MKQNVLDFFARAGRGVWSLFLFLGALALLLILNAQSDFKSFGKELGPYFWPQLWLGVLLLLAAIDCASELTKSRIGRRSIKTQRPPENLYLVIVGTAYIAAYTAAMALIGFPLATVVFVVAFAYLGGYRGLVVLTMTAFGTTVALLYLFVRVVYISLPLGIEPFIEMNVALYRLLGIF